MIHLIIGTKAQFIKMAPVMKGLESRSINYNFVNLGQHGATVKSLSAQFQISGFKFPAGDGKDVVSLSGVLKWAVGHLISIAFMRNYLKEKIFKGQSGIALVHGDTLSTLIGLLMAKRAGLKIAHVESGLRTRNYLNPFPEEMIRVICMRYSDYLFAPSDEAVQNLRKMKLKVEVEGKSRIFNTGGNTGMDAVKIVQSSEFGDRSRGEALPRPFVLVSIHRFENLYSKKRFRFILETVDKVSRRFKVIFVMHGPTERRLKKTGVRSRESGIEPIHQFTDLPTQRIIYLPLQDYPTFLQLINNAEFVITDGGSVQEECFYLGKPCLIMRKRTERVDGVGRNAMLGSFDKTLIDGFIRDYFKFEKRALIPEKSPSAMLIDEITKL